MAATTVWISEAGDGAFKAWMIYDDVSLVCSTVRYDLLAGKAEVRFSTGQKITLALGTGRTVPFPTAKTLSQAPLQEFNWSPA